MFVIHKLIEKEKKVIDVKFININRKFEEITNKTRTELLDHTANSLFPNLNKNLFQLFQDVSTTTKSKTEIMYFDELDKHIEITAFKSEDGIVIASYNDITTQIKSEQQIKKYQTKLKNLIYELFLTEEKSKRQIAIDLHDNFSQLLALTKMKIAEFTMKHKELKEDENIIDSRKYLDEALMKARSMTYDLSPPILYELGLLEAMDWYVTKISNEHKLEIKFFKKISEILFNQESQTIIYRIFTELIINVVKHAKATSVLVIIEHVNDLFYLRISDDGIGFNPNQENNKTDSFGLFSIIERIEQLKGIIHIISSEGKGTVIDISIPV